MLCCEIKQKNVSLKEQEEAVQILQNQLNQAKQVLEQIKTDGEQFAWLSKRLI